MWSELQTSPERLTAGGNNNEWKKQKEKHLAIAALLACQANAAEPKQREEHVGT